MKATYILSAIALVAITSAAMAQSTVPVNMNVAKYAEAHFITSTEVLPSPLFDTATGAQPVYNPINNKAELGFQINLSGNAASGEDTLNLIWSNNAYSQLTTVFTPLSLPGVWTLELDGAGITPPTQSFETDPDEIGKHVVMPVTLRVASVPDLQLAGNYAGTLAITNVNNP